MEGFGTGLWVSGARSSTGGSALRPVTSSTLTVHPQTELQAPSQRGSTHPSTSSAPGESATLPEGDSKDRTYYGTRANTTSDIDDLNLESNEVWPPADSEDDSGGDGSSGTSLKRTPTTKSNTATSKVKAILQKFGKSYNRRYDILPSEAQEKGRNTLQHNIVLEVFDGKLHLAPVENARRVLDLGCGPGDWPLEFAKRNPKTAVLGVDIDPINPPYHLPNCRLQVMDFNTRWSYTPKFDFIHLRHLGGLPETQVITNIYENLSPGGWAEFTEWIVSIRSTRNNFNESAFYKWVGYWKAGLNEMGHTVYYPLEYKRLLTEAGFRNVTERKHAVPINPWPPSKQLQRIGSMMYTNITTSIEPICTPIFTQTLGLSPDAVESLLADVRKEIADVDNMHAYMTLFTVYAQKPRGEYSSESSPRSSEHGY
ncbi:S-adenosyl-L-methionine-dependent methyltransferase [Xylaria sp. FL1777]|nr:S-adenosyl-L-methionine-dependent methyltransferase [Xylaria sp. FL1777]